MELTPQIPSASLVICSSIVAGKPPKRGCERGARTRKTVAPSAPAGAKESSLRPGSPTCPGDDGRRRFCNISPTLSEAISTIGFVRPRDRNEHEEVVAFE